MDAEMDLKKGKMLAELCWSAAKISDSSLAALEKIRADYAKEQQKSSDNSSDSNDESNCDQKHTGAKKKRLLSVPKRDQLIQTVYSSYDNSEAPPSLETGGI